MRKLKIAQIANISERVPPERYGGTERVIYVLTEELVKRGHDVTLFATGDSKTSAKLVSIYPKSLREDNFDNPYGTNLLSLLHIGYAYQRADQFDIIHDHNSYLSLPTANVSPTPVVMTLHGAIGMNERRILENLRGPKLVTISDAQAKFAPNLNFAGTVYNGLEMRNFPFSDSNEGYLLFVGRISREKGVHTAIQVAQYLNIPLIIAAKLDKQVDNPHDFQYFKEYIEPKLSAQIRWIGEVNEKQRNELMSKALCFLHPITWPEPFGLTLIESMACGTPVVGFNLGSIPEIIEDGVNGYVVTDLNSMITAVANINSIDRKKCRDSVVKKFSGENMAKGYEKIYEKMLEKPKIVSNQPQIRQVMI